MGIGLNRLLTGPSFSRQHYVHDCAAVKKHSFGIAQIGIGQVVAIDFQQLIVQVQQAGGICIWGNRADKDANLKRKIIYP